MKFFYSYTVTDEFIPFSFSHFAALVIIIGICILLYFSGRKNKPVYAGILRYSFAFILIFQEIMLRHWRWYNGDLNLQRDLPLELCGLSIIFSAVMLVRKNYFIYEIIYFWGLAAASQALLTPDNRFEFPHFRYFQFFVSHGMIIIAVCYMTFIEKMRPTLKSYLKAVTATFIYAAVISILNYFLNSNYLYLCKKPDTASLMDFFGPWPYYLTVLSVLVFIFFMIVYLPYIFIDRKKS
ncbi:MAG: TIGR02206 family membrane protein [Spirochaetes bacterium]|nr:TIGR02206 family membrane protein [Spirochaetota bacterium]